MGTLFDLRCSALARLPSSWLDVTHSRPDFLIIGGQKCGTTALYDYLVQHNQILPCAYKEVHYFNYQYGKGEYWYRRHFPLQKKITQARRETGLPILTGEASPCYLLFPQTPQRVYDFVPRVKLIVLLRNPVDRAYSHYTMNVAKQTTFDVVEKRRVAREPLPFEAALDAEAERMKTALALLEADPLSRGQWLQMHSYQTRGLYAQHIHRWLQIFPRAQFLFIDSSELKENANAVFQRTLEFLGLEPCQLPRYEPRHVGEYSQPMNPETRARLVAYFQPHNAELYELLGRRFDWDK